MKEGRSQTGGVGGQARGGWLDFQLHFTSPLLSAGATGREDRGGARSWADRPWKFPLCVSALFKDGRGFRVGVWVGGWGVGGGVVRLGSGDLAARQPQQEAWLFHTDKKKKRKKAALDTAWICEHSTSVINQKNRN